MNCKIGVISGDGIGPEIVREARKVLDRAAEKFGHRFDYTELLLGGASIDVHGVSLTEETIEKAKAWAAVLGWLLSNISLDSAIHIEDLSIYKIRRVRGQEHCRAA